MFAEGASWGNLGIFFSSRSFLFSFFPSFTGSWLDIQLYFNGWNPFGTMKIFSRQGLFDLMSVNHTARSEGIIGISFRFS